METKLVYMLMLWLASLENFQFRNEWLDILIREGSKFEYFPEPDKSEIVVNPDFIETTAIFEGMGIQIVTGRKFLGARGSIYRRLLSLGWKKR